MGLDKPEGMMYNASNAEGVSMEDALDLLRAEGCWDPTPTPSAQPPQTGAPGRFVNQCGRCLEFRPSARVELGARSRVWLCAECSGPHPAVIVPQRITTFADFMRSERVRLKELERERKKRERAEAKAKRDSMPRVRKPRAAQGKPKDVEPESA